VFEKLVAALSTKLASLDASREEIERMASEEEYKIFKESNLKNTYFNKFKSKAKEIETHTFQNILCTPPLSDDNSSIISSTSSSSTVTNGKEEFVAIPPSQWGECAWWNDNREQVVALFLYSFGTLGHKVNKRRERVRSARSFWSSAYPLPVWNVGIGTQYSKHRVATKFKEESIYFNHYS